VRLPAPLPARTVQARPRPRTHDLRFHALDPATYSANAILCRNGERWGVENATCELKFTFAIRHFHTENADFIVHALYALMT
jgi:IS4 transposase